MAKMVFYGMADVRVFPSDMLKKETGVDIEHPTFFPKGVEVEVPQEFADYILSKGSTFSGYMKLVEEAEEAEPAKPKPNNQSTRNNKRKGR